MVDLYTIVDWFCENGCLIAISQRRQNMSCEMQWEVHLEQSISMIVCLSRICQCNVILEINNNFSYRAQGSPHIVKTGRLDFSLSWLKGEVRENLGDFRKSIQILTFLSPLPHVPLPFTKNERACKMILKGCN
jgi:hypothetical protein